MMLRSAAQVLQARLSARMPEKKRKTWDQIPPSIRKQYLDIAYEMFTCNNT